MSEAIQHPLTDPNGGYSWACSIDVQFLGYTYGGDSLTFGDRQAKEAGEGASSFSLSGNPGTYRLYSSIHNNNPLTFLGTYPAEWVVRDGGGKATKARETLQLKWQGGGETFTILGYGGQYAEWSARWYEPESEEVFRGTRDKWKATEFVLKIKEPATCIAEKVRSSGHTAKIIPRVRTSEAVGKSCGTIESSSYATVPFPTALFVL